MFFEDLLRDRPSFLCLASDWISFAFALSFVLRCVAIQPWYIMTHQDAMTRGDEPPTRRRRLTSTQTVTRENKGGKPLCTVIRSVADPSLNGYTLGFFVGWEGAHFVCISGTDWRDCLRPTPRPSVNQIKKEIATIYFWWFSRCPESLSETLSILSSVR